MTYHLSCTQKGDKNTIRERNVNLSRIPKAGSCLKARSSAHMATHPLFLPTTEDEMQSLDVSVVIASAESKRPRSNEDGDQSRKKDRVQDVQGIDHGQPSQQPSLAAGMYSLAAPTPPTPPATEHTPIDLPRQATELESAMKAGPGGLAALMQSSDTNMNTGFRAVSLGHRQLHTRRARRARV